jgi:ATP-dependent helicase HrpB
LLQKTTDADVRLSAAVSFDLLSQDRLRTVDECFFHPSQKKVVGRRRLYWLDLMLEESPTEILDDSLAASILLSEVRGRWERAFPGDDKALVQLLGRIRVLNSVAPDEDFPIIDQAWLESLAAEIVVGKRSIEEVRAANWGDHLKAKIGYQKFAKLENLVPATMTAPSGNQLSIDYSNPTVPALSVRLQELFGWTETPRVAGKRMALLLRILAPNYREVQVTSDLANFWRTTYHDVRKELRRRYPKHHWPEDPLTASASRSGLNRDAT